MQYGLVMLNDAQQIAAKFNEAFPQKKGEHSDQEIATACGVTKQAVNGWRATGRIAKKHIGKLAELSNRPLDFWLPNSDGSTTSDSGQLTPTEQKLITGFRAASDADRETLLWLANRALSSRRDAPKDMESAAFHPPLPKDAIASADDYTDLSSLLKE